jgi:hypothetical protein
VALENRTKTTAGSGVSLDNRVVTLYWERGCLRYYYGVRIKENEMVGRGEKRNKEMYTSFWLGNLKKDHLRGLGMMGR